MYTVSKFSKCQKYISQGIRKSTGNWGRPLRAACCINVHFLTNHDTVQVHHVFSQLL